MASYEPIPPVSRLPARDSQSSDTELIFDDDEDYKKGDRNKHIFVGVVVSVIAIVIIVACAFSFTNNASKKEGPADGKVYTAVIDLNCSLVRGVQEDGILVFKGLPYATAPVGELRWQAPVPYEDDDECWALDQTYGDNFQSQCLQFDQQSKQYKGTEDCLHLNVWTPSLTPDHPLDVIVYIHGGGLMGGSGNQPGASPNTNVTRASNVVYVSFNYRLNVFGFLALDDRTLSGNYGFMDQVLALKWVQKNIHHFGGNPKQVTLIGEGSGATSITVLLSVAEARGLFHRAWLMSPSPRLDATAAQAYQQNLLIVNKTDCRSEKDSRQDLNKCLLRLSGEELLETLPMEQWHNSHLHDFPSKDEHSFLLAIVDGHFLKKSPIESWKSEMFHDIPIVIGSTAQEVDDRPAPRNLSSWQWSDFDAHLQAKLKAFQNPSLMEKINELYGHQGSPQLQFTSMVSDLRAVCPLNEVANVAQSKFKRPVYRYIANHIPSNTTTTADSKHFAFHGIDVLALFGLLDHISSHPTIHESQFADFVQMSVNSLAHYGHLETDWAPYPTEVALLSFQKIFEAGTYNRDKCEFWRTNGFFPPYAWVN